MSPDARHPDCEALACLAEGRCSREEREALLEHLAACGTCLDVYDGTLRALAGDASAGTVQVKGQVSQGHPPTPPRAGGAGRQPPTGRGWPLMPVVAIAAMGILAAGLTLAVWTFLVREPSGTGLPALVEAVGGRRLIEPRLSGGFTYAPMPGSLRGPASLPSLPGATLRSPEGAARQAVEMDEGDWEIIVAAKRIRDEAGDGVGSIAEARSLAAAHLLTGNAPEAVRVLRAGLDRFGEDAAALSDLAAAYLVEAGAVEGEEPGAVLRVRALDAARHAVEVDPGMVEGWFNLALAMQHQLEAAGSEGTPTAGTGPVTEAWKDYLERDPDSPWAGEARRRIRGLEDSSSSWVPPSDDELLGLALAGDRERLAETLRAAPGRVRRVVERLSLCRWSEACLRGDAATAAAELDAAGVLARAYQSATGDSYYVRVVAGLGPGNAPARARVQGLCSSVQSLCEGLHRTGDMSLEEAAARIGESVPVLSRTGNPLRWSSELSMAIDEYYAGRSRDSERRLTRLLNAPEIVEYPTLEGLALWMRGTVRAVRFDLAPALGDHTRALDLFRRCNALGYVASEHRLLAEVYGLLGRPAEGWRHRESAMALAPLADGDRLAALNLEAVYASLDLHLPWAALVMASRVPDRDERIFEGTRLQAPLVRAQALEMAGRPEAAQAELVRAAGLLSAAEEREMLARYRAEVDESRGRVLRRTDRRAALDRLESALDFFAAEGEEDPLLASRAPAILLAMGEILRELDRPHEAERALERGIALLEEATRRLSGTPYMISMADRAWALYDEMIDLQAVELDHPEKGLAFVERARAVDLAPVSARLEAEASDAGWIAAAVPRGTALVYFVSLEDHLLAWVVRDGEIRFRRTEAPRGELRRRTDALTSALGRRSSGGIQQAHEELYEILIRPVEPWLAGAAELRLVPDGFLGNLPFAVLRDAPARRYLVEKWALGIAPGAAALRRGAPRAIRDGEILVVGRPAMAAEWRARFAALPGAEREARAVAALYRDSTLLTGPEATAEAFLERAGRSRIIHFAGHAVANTRHPDLSALILAPEEGVNSTGLLLARDIARTPLSEGALIVLGGCRTAAGPPSRTAGSMSLARPFLAAGAAQVIGTLWDLDDGVGEKALVRLHTNLQRGDSAILALQRTQKEFISADDPALRMPATWGAFTLVGRGAS